MGLNSGSEQLNPRTLYLYFHCKCNNLTATVEIVVTVPRARADTHSHTHTNTIWNSREVKYAKFLIIEDKNLIDYFILGLL